MNYTFHWKKAKADRYLTLGQRDWLIKRMDPCKYRYSHVDLIKAFFGEFWPRKAKMVIVSLATEGKDPNDPSLFVQKANQLYPRYVRVVGQATRKMAGKTMEIGR